MHCFVFFLQIVILQERVSDLQILAVAQSTGIDGVRRCRQRLQELSFFRRHTYTAIILKILGRYIMW